MAVVVALTAPCEVVVVVTISARAVVSPLRLCPTVTLALTPLITPVVISLVAILLLPPFAFAPPLSLALPVAPAVADLAGLASVADGRRRCGAALAWSSRQRLLGHDKRGDWTERNIYIYKSLLERLASCHSWSVGLAAAKPPTDRRRRRATAGDAALQCCPPPSSGIRLASSICSSTNFTITTITTIPMAPLSVRRTHNLLLISKLLNPRDAASPLTLVLDSLQQPAAPLLREYIRRAQVARARRRLLVRLLTPPSSPKRPSSSSPPTHSTPPPASTSSSPRAAAPWTPSPPKCAPPPPLAVRLPFLLCVPPSCR